MASYMVKILGISKQKMVLYFLAIGHQLRWDVRTLRLQTSTIIHFTPSKRKKILPTVFNWFNSDKLVWLGWAHKSSFWSSIFVTSSLEKQQVMEYHGMFGTGLIFFLLPMLASLWKCERFFFAIDPFILSWTKMRLLYLRLLLIMSFQTLPDL